MSVKRRLAGYSGMRVDWPHIRAIESSVSFDFDSVLRGMFTGLNKPYLIRGFRVVIPNAAISATSLQVEVADSAVLHSSATESGTILTVPQSSPVETLDPSSNTRVIGSFQSNAINYISLDYRRQTDTSTVDQTAGWSASQKIEFQRAVPIGRVLDYRFVITTSGFSTNLPLYIVKVNANGSVEWITKATTNFFRLGSGGANPNPANSYNFGNLNNPQTGNRREWINTNPSISSNPLTVAPNDPATAFDYGDFAIKNMKEWMDAVMTRFKEVTGSPYWYLNQNTPAGEIKLTDLWWDSVGSVMTGTGEISYNLVLESVAPEFGRFQDVNRDSTILPGDVYALGKSSGTKATVTSYNGGQLIVNSLTSAAFTFGEDLEVRRLFRPSGLQFTTLDFSYVQDPWSNVAIYNDGDLARYSGKVYRSIQNGNTGNQPDTSPAFWEVYSDRRYANLKRIPFLNNPTTVGISSWSYQNTVGTGLFYSKITVDTTAPHGFEPGDVIRVVGLQSTVSTAPNGVAFIKDVPSSTQFTYYTPILQIGATSVLVTNGAVLESTERIPYMPRFSVESWSYTGSSITLTVPEHNFKAPLLTTADTTLGDENLTAIPSTEDLKVGMKVSGAGIPAGTIITKIVSTSSVELSQKATATAAGVAVTFTDVIHVSGLIATTDAPNGTFEVTGLGPGFSDVQYTAGATPTGTATVNALSYVSPDVHECKLSLVDAAPLEYNVSNSSAFMLSDASGYFTVGQDSLPALGNATGQMEYDGVIAESIVQDPLLINSMSKTGSVLTVNTANPHGLSPASNITFTIFGDATNSIYIRTYTSVNLAIITPTQFTLSGVAVSALADGSYTNPGGHKTFAKFADNPYPGPIAWDSDIVIKGVIGEKAFTVPKTAIAYTTSEDPNVSPEANNFNVNGITGTVYVRDGEVAFVLLERNKMVSNGSEWSTAGGGAAIIGSIPPTDELGQFLVAGDYVKFEDEDEAKWLKIAGIPGTSINTNSFTLVDDSGQAPDSIKRPAKSGKLLYSKAVYDKVYVKKHHLVNLSGDVYWLAVRRDNNGDKAKVYFRGLEVEAGEVRQINDNQISNLLKYTGAYSESAVNPNYTVADTTGEYQFTKALTVEAVDNLTRMITFESDPEKGFQAGDRIMKVSGPYQYFYTVRFALSSRTVVVVEETTTLAALDSVTYYRQNKNINDQDNLTLAMRKEDRELGWVQSALNRPIYDESVYVQQINLSGAGTVRSGSYVYKGSQTNPSALAWVLHGNAAVAETIESAPVSMPGGHSSVGSNAILVHIVHGTFSDGDGLFQNGAATGRTVNNPGNPSFAAPALVGGTGGTGIELVLPPNKRTQVVGTEYIVFGTHANYKASTDLALTGEELLLIVNDGVRQAGLDYEETFGGPKGKVRLIRSCPPNTRMRFRVLPAYGSALAAKSSDVTLQTAYNGGATIQCMPGRPVEITSADVNSGAEALVIRGSMLVNGGPSALGGIFNEGSDKSFVIGNEADKPKESWTALEALKSHDSHPDSGVKRKTAAQTITGDTGTVITDSAVTLTDGQAYRILVKATARRSDGPVGVASFRMEGTFYRSGGGALSAGSPISIINGADGDGVNYALAFGLSGNDVVAVGYGTSGATLQWAITVEWQAVGLAS